MSTLKFVKKKKKVNLEHFKTFRLHSDVMKKLFVFDMVGIDAENVFHMFIWVDFCSMHD